MENIIKSIKSYYPVPNESIDSLCANFTKHVFPRKHIFIKGGRLDSEIYFIEKGLTRSFFYVNGDEITSWFSKEGDVTFGLLDLYRNKPGFEYVETIEETVVYSIPIKRMEELCQKDIHIANWFRVIHQECVLALQYHRIDNLTLNSKDRYEQLLKRIPYITQRVQLTYIASFIGISNSTLSRIRNII